MPASEEKAIAGSPYRRAPPKRRETSRLALRDNSPALVGLVSAFLMAVGLWFLEFPRAVMVRCVPRDETHASLRCTSRAVIPLLGAEERVEATLVCRRPRVGSYVLESEGPLDQIDVGFGYRGGGTKRPAETILTASCEGASIDLTRGHRGALSSEARRKLSAFRASLRLGVPATLEYRLGFGEWIFAAMLVPFALLLVVGAGARTVVVLDLRSGRVELERRTWLFGKGTRAELDKGEIRGVVVARFIGYRGGRGRSPALDLASGRLLRLSEAGFSPSSRAETEGKKLAELLGVPFGRTSGPFVDVDESGAPVRR